MNLNSLKIALNVAKMGSIAETARQMDLDPSNVSRAIAGLEAELGIRLFHRSTRSLSLTEEGSIYLERIEAIVEDLDVAQDEARGFNQTPKGTLRMTASVAFGTTCITPLLKQFRTAWPDLKLELILSDDNLDLNKEGLDLAIRLSPEISGDWICRRLIDTHYHVCASPEWIEEHPLANPQDLSAVECLRLALPEYKESWFFKNQSGLKTHVPVDGPLILSNPLALRSAATEGLGPALLATWLSKEPISQGKLQPLFDDYRVTATTFDTGLFALYPSRSFLPSKTRVALDFFANAFKKDV